MAPHKQGHRVNRYKLRFIVLAVLILTSPPSAQTNLAVIPLEAKGLSHIEAGLLTDRLGLELSRTGLFTVLERDKMDSILTKQNFQLTNWVSEERLVEAGRLLDVEQIFAGTVVKVGNTYSAIFWLIDARSGAIVQLTSYDHQGTLAQLWSFGMNVIAGRFAGPLVEPDRQSVPVDSPKVASAARPPRRVRKGDLYFLPRLGVGRSGWGDVLSLGGQIGYGRKSRGKVFVDVLSMYDYEKKQTNSLNILALYEFGIWILYWQFGVGYVSDQNVAGIGYRVGGGLNFALGKNLMIRPAVALNLGKQEGQSSFALILDFGFKMPGGQ